MANLLRLRDGFPDSGPTGSLLSHIIYEPGISGGAATRLLGSLNRENGPTVYLFDASTATGITFCIDQP